MHYPLDIILFFTAILAGFVDAIAGGGGIVTLPVMLSLGLPPVLALGTNRFQGLVGECVASFHFFRHKLIAFKKIMPVFFVVVISASLGTVLVQHTDQVFLQKLIPILLLLVLCYAIFSGRLFKTEKKLTLTLLKFAIMFGGLIGFYNGFFGPGTGSFWVVAFYLFYACDIRQATIYAKPVNMMGNLASFLCFASRGDFILSLVIVMSLGQIIGASLGARMVIYRGLKIIKPVFIVVVFLMTIELLLKAF